MKFSYYTIDDLRLGHDPTGVTGWRLRSFLSLDRALAQYRAMPSTKVKSLGLTDGEHVLELARCHPLLPGDQIGEDILASDYRKLPVWQNIHEAEEAVNTCVSALGLRYQLDESQLVPVPTGKRLSGQLRRVCLRSENAEDSIRWAYVVGEGLIPYKALKQPRSSPPLVLYYLVECVTRDNTIVSLQVKPWEYEQLARRTKMRRA